MDQQIAPIPVRPWTLNGISERMIVSHYENNYGAVIRTLNAVRRDIAAFDRAAAPDRFRALRREELRAMNSIELHERYFANLGGEGRTNVGLAGARTDQMPDSVSAVIEQHFGSVGEWRRDFVGCAQSLTGDAGWVLLSYSRRQKRLSNQIGTDHAQAPVDAAPVLVLDMYEHAYHLDFETNAKAYIDAFMRNINWATVHERIAAVRADRPLPEEDPSDLSRPSLSVEELAGRVAKGEPIQVIDARPRHHISRTVDLMAGATWRDPERLEEWIDELSPDQPVAVYCAYGFHIGCNVAVTLRERGFDARYVRGGISAWYAAGGARAMHPAENSADR